MAYEYFVCEAILCPEVFDMLYQKFVHGELSERVCKLALLKFWAENIYNGMEVPEDVARSFILELLNDDVYFPFYTGLVELVPELHYIKNSTFVEYRTQPQSQVYMHYVYDDSSPARESADQAADINYDCYEIREMKEMYEGIHVSMFQLFHGETVQYYITESSVENGEAVQERVTQSGTLSGKSEADDGSLVREAQNYAADDRFNILNDIMLSISLQDEATAQQLTEEYIYQDFCVRELFKVL